MRREENLDRMTAGRATCGGGNNSSGGVVERFGRRAEYAARDSHVSPQALASGCRLTERLVSSVVMAFYGVLHRCSFVSDPRI